MRYSLAVACGVTTAVTLSLIFFATQDVAAVIIVGMAMLASFIGIGIAAILDAIYHPKTEERKPKT